MDNYNGSHPSSGEERDCDCDNSLQTQPSTPPVPDTGTSSDSQPPAKPPRSTDIPADPAPRPFQNREPAYYDGLTLLTAEEQATQRWELPRRPEFGTLAKRIHTFYQETARWDPEGKPSVGSIAVVGFIMMVGLQLLLFKFSTHI